MKTIGKRIMTKGLVMGVSLFHLFTFSPLANAQQRSWTADNGNGTFTNPLTGATYTETELKDALDSRAHNADLIRRDAAQAPKAVEEQRADNQHGEAYDPLKINLLFIHIFQPLQEASPPPPERRRGNRSWFRRTGRIHRILSTLQ
jgi:hypothetical protein